MLDVRTLIFVLALGNIGFTLMLAGYASGTSPSLAMRLWMAARLLQGVSHLLVWMRPDLPPQLVGPIAGYLAITGLIVGYGLEVAANFEFFGIPRWRRLLYPLILAALGSGELGSFMGISSAGAMALASCIFSAFLFIMAVTMLWQPNGRSLLRTIIGCNYALFGCIMLVRAYVSVNAQLGLFSPAPVHMITCVAGYFLLVVNGFGFLLLCKQADDACLIALATTDSLTGLANRRAFFDRTDVVRTLFARSQRPVSLLMLDIDHFKRLNDKYGHATGDEALRIFAKTAQRQLREQDIMGRLGGEEFAIALPDTDLDGAVRVAERIRAAIAAAEVPMADSLGHITVSIGVVRVEPAEDIHTALARADGVLYVAKSGGRDRVETARSELKQAPGSPGPASLAPT